MSNKNAPKNALEQLQTQVENIVGPMGYEVVALEQSQAPGTGRVLTLFIDFIQPEGASVQEPAEKRIGLDDCIAVNAAVDELFETTSLLDGHYTLEVSSPGVERPLRKAKDFHKFRGTKARLNTFRPLSAEELENENYWKTHQKQKNFVGILDGLDETQTKVKLVVDKDHVVVPLDLISKAHLEYVAKEQLS